MPERWEYLMFDVTKPKRDVESTGTLDPGRPGPERGGAPLCVQPRHDRTDASRSESKRCPPAGAPQFS